MTNLQDNNPDKTGKDESSFFPDSIDFEYFETAPEEQNFQSSLPCFVVNLLSDVELYGWKQGDSANWVSINPPVRQTCSYTPPNEDQCKVDGKWREIGYVACDQSFNLYGAMRQLSTGKTAIVPINNYSASCRAGRAVLWMGRKAPHE